MYTDIAPASGFDLTGDAFIDALFAPEAYFRTKWAATLGGKTSISYSFPFLNGLVSKFTDTYGAEPAAAQHFGVNALQVAGIDQAFQRWADVANLSFIKVPEDASGVVGDIRISFSSEVTVDFWGYTKIYSDGSDPSQGDIWIEPGITRAELEAEQAPAYRDPTAFTGLSLVLGAGNVASLGPRDVLSKLFVEGKVVVLKAPLHL